MAESAELDEDTNKPVLETLKLSDNDSDCENHTTTDSDCRQKALCPCLLCERIYDISEANDELLRHLAMEHKFVVADVNLIADLKKYCTYWKQRLKEEPIKMFCSVICTNMGPEDEGDKENYYLLSNVLEEDKKIREFLQKKKLESVLSSQQAEREDMTFCRGCLFCREQFSGKRSVYFDHLTQDHSFNIGHPDNLVYTDELLDKLQSKLDNLQCLYCEKTFKDRTVLKEHMRKKQHKRINPKNRSYDKYYVINYLEMGKNWEVIQSEHDIAYDTEGNTDTEDEWEGWEESGSQAVCLFCEFASGNAERLNSHMQELHDLDLNEIKLRLNLNFYQQVKLVNYIRRQVHLGICMGCGETFGGKSELVDHMHQLGHITEIPDISIWDQPQYFFPTYENDNLLCQLDDTADDGCDVIDHHGNLRVIAEDFPVVETILSEESVRKNVLGT